MNLRLVIAVGLMIGVHGIGLPLAAQTSYQNPSDYPGTAAAATDALGDLPLTVNPAPAGHYLAVVLSGDGGWAAGDKSLAQSFVAESVAVVGLNSPRYLERERTPEEASADLARIIQHFLYTWTRQSIILVGYSHGADIAPFMVSRLPAELRKQVAILVLLGPGKQASFKFSLLDLARSHHGNGGLPVEPEVSKLRGTALLCIYGASDRGAICDDLATAGLARALRRPGGHVVGGQEGPGLVRQILAEVQAPHAPGR